MNKSIRQTDGFFNDEKQLSRINNIKALEQTNLIQEGKLVCSWCELMGSSGMETLFLLEERSILKSGGFIGVDLDEKHIDDFKYERPDLQWYVSNIFDLIPMFDDVGVLNLDVYGNVGYDKDYRDLSLIKGLARKSIEKFGEFILFYNKDLDGTLRQNQRPEKMLRYHTNKICQSFNDYLPNRKFDPLTILPINSEQEIENGFIGAIGAYEIYKGKANGHRMANLRLIFR
jgi:hypothetical protein